MKTESQPDKVGAWILFPDIIRIAILAVLLPLPLVHLLLSGQALEGSVGLALWAAALYSTVRFLRRRLYLQAWIPMLVLVGLFLTVHQLIR